MATERRLRQLRSASPPSRPETLATPLPIVASSGGRGPVTSHAPAGWTRHSKRRGHPRRQGVPRGQPRLPRRRRKKNPGTTSLAAGKGHGPGPESAKRLRAGSNDSSPPTSTSGAPRHAPEHHGHGALPGRRPNRLPTVNSPESSGSPIMRSTNQSLISNGPCRLSARPLDRRFRRSLSACWSLMFDPGPLRLHGGQRRGRPPVMLVAALSWLLGGS